MMFITGFLIVFLVCYAARVRWLLRRLQQDSDGIVLRYLDVANRYEELVREVTEPYGGVVSALDCVRWLTPVLSGLTDEELRRQSRCQLNQLEHQLAGVLRMVASRYRLSPDALSRYLTLQEAQ